MAGKILAVVNQKGGVGKTTTAVNLAASIAASERATLLIDMDPQANASSAYGITDPPQQLYHALIGSCPVKDVIMPTEMRYLHIVPSGQDLVGAEIELVSAMARERRLELALADLRESYEMILIDCPPSLGLLTLNALTAADSVLIPLQCEYYALEGLARLLQTKDLVKSQLNPKLELEGIALTMVDMRNNLSRQVEAEVREHFGDKVYRTRIPRNVRLSEAPSHGKPILLYDAHSRGAVAYLKLAEELLARQHTDSCSPSSATAATAATAEAIEETEATEDAAATVTTVATDPAGVTNPASATHDASAEPFAGERALPPVAAVAEEQTGGSDEHSA